MGQLIAIVGNTGVGKSTLSRALAADGRFVTGLEQHAERPFQQLFAQNLGRYGFANQVDYLLLRAEQERAIRSGPRDGIQDGGLDLDFQVWTRHFHAKGFLSDSELAVCERLYTFARETLPLPEVVIHLVAPLPILEARYRSRARTLEIATPDDIAGLEVLTQAWVGSLPPERVLQVDASLDDPTYARALPGVLEALERCLVR